MNALQLHSALMDAHTEGWGFELRCQNLLSGVGGVFPELKSNRLADFRNIFSIVTSHAGLLPSQNIESRANCVNFNAKAMNDCECICIQLHDLFAHVGVSVAFE